jgi:hypothetical protein
MRRVSDHHHSSTAQQAKKPPHMLGIMPIVVFIGEFFTALIEQGLGKARLAKARL